MAHTLTIMRRFIVWLLLRACEAQDLLRLDYLTHSHRLAGWSAQLDERWGTSVWRKTPDAGPARPTIKQRPPTLKPGAVQPDGGDDHGAT